MTNGIHPSNVGPKVAPRWARRSATLAARGLVLTAALAAGGLTALTARPDPTLTPEVVGAGRAEFNFRVALIPVPGRVEGLRPRLRFDPNDLSRASGRVVVDLIRLETGIALRDEHARNFLGVGAHPEAVFTLARLVGAKALEPGQVVKATAEGNLSFNGVARPLEAPVILRLAPDRAEVLVKANFDVAFADHRISIPGADPKTDVTVSFAVPVPPVRP